MDNEYKDYEFPVQNVITIIVCFALAVLDMMFLYKALQRVAGTILGSTDQAGIFMIVAFIIATVANYTAFEWGRQNGKRMAKKTINKYSLGSFAAWAAIGISYFAIRIIDLIKSIENGETNIVGHIVVMGILAISYIGTGALIQSSERGIFDAELSAIRKAKKRFEKANEDLADSYADLKESIGILKSYDINYKTLDVQYRKCLTSMIRTENATMSVIVGRMLAKHGDINPKLADEILKEVIDARNDKWLEQEVAKSVKGM